MHKRTNGEGTMHFYKSRGLYHYRVVLGYDDQQKPIRKSFYAKDPETARAKGQKALAELQGRQLTVTPDMRLDNWLTLYLQGYKQGKVQGRWLDQLETMRSKLPANLKRKKVSAVTPVELQRFINEFAAKHSKSYADKLKTLLKSAFSEAQENGLCVQNPARKLTVPPKPEKPREAYTAAEAGRIIKAAWYYENKTIAAATVTLLLTGIRRGEMLGLRWNDIDGDFLYIRRGVYLEGNKPVVEEYRAKTASSIRDVPLLPAARTLIEALPRHSEYIFSSKQGNLMEPHNFNRRYKTFIDKIGCIQTLPPHCLDGEIHPDFLRCETDTVRFRGGTGQRNNLHADRKLNMETTEEPWICRTRPQTRTRISSSLRIHLSVTVRPS